MKRILLLSLLFLIAGTAFTQGSLGDIFSDEDPADKLPVIATFKTTRLINAETNEQVKKGELDFRIAHRFDDISGQAGGIKTLFGFDNVTDIRFSFDYGITDKWAVGFARSKGPYFFHQILDFSTKIKLVTQRNKGGFPLAVSAFLDVGLTPMKSSSDIYSITYFQDNFAHRMNYVTQLILARKVTSWFSVEMLPTWVHRNYVEFGDKNDLFALGVGGRVKFTKRLGIVVDYFHTFDKNRTPQKGFFDPLGIGLEIETGGHVFHILFSNNRGLIPGQFLTENRSDWLKGQFRMGFNISRVFNLLHKKEKNENS
ncbi:MAG: hypothetical protein H6581_11710 [Bacteroidia bacterium]|nr:hypothetical protein [Bacteroidia bacterium]